MRSHRFLMALRGWVAQLPRLCWLLCGERFQKIKPHLTFVNMRYVALLRGIGPTNPNMKGERLRSVFEEIGFTNVHPVIASGNVIFDSPSKNPKPLEAQIEKALPERLGFSSTTIVRTKEDLQALVQKSPFAGVRDEKPNYLLVTFFKNRSPELCTVINLNEGKTPDFMRKLEQQHGRAITSRTWKTIARILKKMAETERS